MKTERGHNQSFWFNHTFISNTTKQQLFGRPTILDFCFPTFTIERIFWSGVRLKSETKSYHSRDWGNRQYKASFENWNGANDLIMNPTCWFSSLFRAADNTSYLYTVCVRISIGITFHILHISFMFTSVICIWASSELINIISFTGNWL